MNDTPIKIEVREEFLVEDAYLPFSYRPSVLKKIIEDTEKIEDITQKVKFIYSNTRMIGLFGQITFVIDGKEYLYGIGKADYNAQIVGNFLIDKLTEVAYWREEASIIERTGKINDPKKIKEFLQDELSFVERPYRRYLKYMMMEFLDPQVLN